jgi:hypothetical protein
LKPTTNTDGSTTVISRAYCFRLCEGNQTKINEFKKPENKPRYNAQSQSKKLEIERERERERERDREEEDEEDSTKRSKEGYEVWI